MSIGDIFWYVDILILSMMLIAELFAFIVNRPAEDPLVVSKEEVEECFRIVDNIILTVNKLIAD